MSHQAGRSPRPVGEVPSAAVRIALSLGTFAHAAAAVRALHPPRAPFHSVGLAATRRDDQGERMVMTIDAARQFAHDGIAQPGEWLSGPERCAAWSAARDPRAMPEELSTVELDVVQRIAIDPGGLTRDWADGAIAEIGEGRYVELAAIAAITRVLDVFDLAMGNEPAPIPSGLPGSPTKERPGDVGDVGAWVSQSTGPTRANVSRTFSLLQTTNDLWRGLVDSHYSRGAEFMELEWDRPLSRPQVELVAARTTALNECFY